MAIRLKVNKKEHERVKALGACWLPEEKIWVIPDDVRDINPYMEWLPGKECLIVQGSKRPILRTRSFLILSLRIVTRRFLSISGY